MKFLHTADWQIGMRAEGLGRAAERVRAARLEAGRKAMELARGEQVDFVVVAGDLFEDNAVARPLVQQTADILASAGCDVYLLPGNHDPLAPGSVWDHPAWAACERLFVLGDRDPIHRDGVTLYPCPLTEKYGLGDPTGHIAAHDAPGIRIGIAHGSLEGIAAADEYFPVAQDAAERAGLHYLALGHWHSTYPPVAEAQACRMAYSGTHEQSRFGERDSGNVLVVEVAESGAVRITPHRTGVLTWTSAEYEIASREDLERAVHDVNGAPNPGDTLTHVTLRGVLTPGAVELMNTISDLLETRFLHGRLDASGLRPSPEDDEWIERLPRGPVRQAATMLRDAAALPDDSQAVTASRALLELYMLAGEGDA